MQTEKSQLAELDIPDFLKASIKEREDKYRKQQTIEESRAATEAYNRIIEKRKQRIPTSAFIADSLENTINYITNRKNIRKIAPAAILCSAILFYTLFSRNGNAEEARGKAPAPEQKPDNNSELEQKVESQNPTIVRKVVPLTEEEKIVYERFKPHIDTFRYVAKTTGRDPLLYASLVGAESDYKSSAVSTASAVGLSQMTDIAFDDLQRVQENLKDEIKKQKSKVRFYEVTHDAKNAEKLETARNKVEYLQGKYNKLTLLVGPKLDRQRYDRDPAYQIQVGAAYFDILIDYFNNLQVVGDGNGYDLETKGKGPQGFNPTEAAASSYNYGITATKKLIFEYGPSWNKHKPAETDIHWSRIIDYGRKLESIEQKVANPKMVSMGKLKVENYQFN